MSLEHKNIYKEIKEMYETIAQIATFDKLIAAWAAQRVDLCNLTKRMVGTDLIVSPGPAWPQIRIGTRGGIQILQLKSYPENKKQSAFDAAVKADILLAKQLEREKVRMLKKLQLVVSGKKKSQNSQTTQVLKAA